MHGMRLPWVKQTDEVPEANRRLREAKSADRARLEALPKEQLLEMARRQQAIHRATFGERSHPIS